MTAILGVNWRPASLSGWGVFATNLLLHLEVRGAVSPALLCPLVANDVIVDPVRRAFLLRVFERSDRLQAQWRQAKGKALDFPVLLALGHDFVHETHFPATDRLGMIFFENPVFSKDGLARARSLRRIIAGSHWNARVLRQLGLEHVDVVLQGIDHSLFCPGPSQKLFGERFVIFAGGKLEFRKGQDIVVAAYRAFHQRHPDSLLLTSWGSPFSKMEPNLQACPHVGTLPRRLPNGQLDVAGWLHACGLPEGSFLDMGLVPNMAMPPILRECHAAVAVSRCEGGTNLVAMEAMACAVPTILSANTGHLDLIEEGNCFALRHQPMPQSVPDGIDPQGWGETSVEELLEALEAAYAHRTDALARGQAGHRTLNGLAWSAQVRRLEEVALG